MSTKGIFLEDLRVFASPFPKRRLGKRNDGGYVICEGLEYDCFLSGGIATDISFEEEFLSLHPTLHCHAHDGTIARLPRENSRITFHKKNVGPANTDRTTNLASFLDEHRNIMLKLDIERGEYGWFSALHDRHLENIRQLVIEIHDPFTEDRWRILSGIAKTHWLVHFHPNNCCGIVEFFGTRIPKIFECTYIRKSDVRGQLDLSNEPVPSAIDERNAQKKPDIQLFGHPFNQLTAPGL